MMNPSQKNWNAKNPEKIKAIQKKWREAHKEEILAKARKYYAEHPEKMLEKGKKYRGAAGYETRRRNAVLNKNYGISIEQFDAMAVAQDYKCAGCGTDKPGGTGSWHVDHCHKSDVVRGLLCWKCNVTLGLVGDDPKLLQGLMDYLGKYQP